MLIIRPVQTSDLEQVYQLARKAPAGLTTLPCDREKLGYKIRESVKNLDYPPSKAGGESFLFVLEDNESQTVIGTSAVFTKIGGFQPFWTYEIKSLKNTCSVLGVDKNIDYLQVKTDHDGPSEIGTLFLAPEHRQKHAGRFLSLSRFLFMAEYKHMFEDCVLAELRGTINDDGSAVFWDAIGSHFFGIPYGEADRMVTDDKSFIERLMPKFPIYIPLLPKEAQLVMGVVAEDTRPALRLLEQEGFEKIPEVDIFEAGPILSCKTSDIRSIRQSKVATLMAMPSNQSWDDIFAESTSHEVPRLYMVANINDIKSYRATVSEVFVDNEGLFLPEATITSLNINPGDEVRYSPLRAESKR